MARETVTRLSVVPGGRPRCRVTAVCGAQGLLPRGLGQLGKVTITCCGRRPERTALVGWDPSRGPAAPGGHSGDASRHCKHTAAVWTGSCGGGGPAPSGRADHYSPPPQLCCRARGVTSDPWPGPRPEERLASSCSTSSSCRGSLNRINLLENGDHRCLGARCPRAAPRPGRQRALEFRIDDRGGEEGGGTLRSLQACRGKPAMPLGDQALEGRLRLPPAPYT